MRLFGTACTALVSTLAGCSLLYNPNNLPQPKVDAAPVIDAAPADVPPDMATDANLDMPSFTQIAPGTLLEGQGTGGSRPAILTIVGNFGPDATVAIEPTAGPDPTILIQVDSANLVRSTGVLAVPVILPVDPMHGNAAATDVPLTVTVTQTGGDQQPVQLVITGKVTLTNLPELTAPITAVASSPPLYSQVKVTMPITFTASAAAARALIRAVGSIELLDVHADGGSGAPGPGGGAGGTTAPPAAGGGAGGGKAAILLTLGSTASGGGFGEAGGPGTGLAAVAGGVMSGDALITSYDNNGSGGGGGGGSVGGGGGGTLEITAGGTLTVGKVSANGGGGGNSGGGGSGGAIVLRAGGLAKLNGSITASGGTAAGGVGGGGLGRLRYDLAAQMGTPVMTAVKHAGVAFDAMPGVNPLVTRDRSQRLRVLGEPGSTVWTVFSSDATGTASSSTFTFGSASASIPTSLVAGFNRVCVTPPMGRLTTVESTNCIDIAYVPDVP
jgi:hypothetical protein